MPDLSTAALQACALHQTYGLRPVLKGLDFEVAPGEIYALLGGNGAGKSTTLSVFLGLARPTSGVARVCGRDVAADPGAARANIAYVPENVAFYDHLSARETLDYMLTIAGAADRSRATVDAALDAVGLVEEAWDRRVGGFSKGMRQKVAIALAIARQTPVLLLDEPTSGLDPRATAEFNRLLQTARERRVATLMVTHDLLSAAEIADRIGFLSAGRIEEEVASGAGDRFDLSLLHQRYVQSVEAA
ncbi:putative ABC transporter ATP-binding protein NosF [Brevundimonas sp. NIBR10]|uniref:ABC transporter ATP-binding protein n=1 Tax=Brevundimonas sp. NIBR10 TaxID=3015997 RepID=UPI0022F1AC6C|nr:ABC transporter ATP-binding protein [Brevundimonas sp. NIBR10]WGM45914.1 putative ABC transporter ATP-binding protein NosF [Brevundimonas sp. NIBR10]